MKQLFKHVIILSGDQEYASDILLCDGIITKIADNINGSVGMDVYEMENAYVSDGWVEAHTHMDWEPGQLCLDTDSTYAADGITYAIDAGTDGPANYHALHEKLSKMPIRAKAYLNVALNGVSRLGKELTEPGLLDKAAFRETYAQYKDEIIGVKIRIDPRVNSDLLGTLAKSRELADELGLPLIVHPTRCTEPLEKVLQFLGKNDVYAHTYSAFQPCILDENGTVKECAREARKRGVWFDLSHGSANFSFDVARKAIDQDFVVDTISTDLHSANLTGPVRSIADTMSKMLYLGMPLHEIIHKVTIAPAKMLGLQDREFGIYEGKRADLTFFRVEDGKFTLEDSTKKTVCSEKRITPVLTVLDDRTFSPRRCIKMQVNPDQVAKE